RQRRAPRGRPAVGAPARRAGGPGGGRGQRRRPPGRLPRVAGAALLAGRRPRRGPVPLRNQRADEDRQAAGQQEDRPGAGRAAEGRGGQGVLQRVALRLDVDDVEDVIEERPAGQRGDEPEEQEQLPGQAEEGQHRHHGADAGHERPGLGVGPRHRLAERRNVGPQHAEVQRAREGALHRDPGHRHRPQHRHPRQDLHSRDDATMALQTSYFPADTSEPVLDTTVGGILRDAAAEVPDAPALIEGCPDPSARRRWSYAELLTDAERAAHALRSRFEPGEQVAIWAPNIPEWVILEFGAALAGMTLVTVNPAYKPAEVRYVLTQSRSS